MRLLASLVLLAVSAGVELIDEVHQIPAGDWKFREIRLTRPARISASYEVLSGTGQVRVALMLREDLERMGPDLPGSIAMTAVGRRGRFDDTIRRRGDYVVVLDNQNGKQAVAVRLQVWADSSRAGPEVGQLTPQRQVLVVAISFALFFGIVGFSAKRLLKAIRH